MCTDGLQGTDEGIGGAASGVYVVDDDDLPSLEEVSVDLYEVLDVGGEFIVACDMDTPAASADPYAVVAVYGIRGTAQQVGEPFPPACVGVGRACRDAYDDAVADIHACEGTCEHPGHPSGIDVVAVLEAEDHVIHHLLLK